MIPRAPLSFSQLACGLFAMLLSATPIHAVAQSQGQGQGREFLRRIPEVIQPEPFDTTRTKVGAARVNYPVDPQSLSQALSKNLSEACARLEFNQTRHGRYFVLVARPDKDPLRFGYAQGDGVNLRDPTGLRGADVIYLFDRDETSECKVYVYPKTF
jgi:hypothetical protein